MNPYLVLIGAFALWYIPGALALYKMEYSLRSLQLVAIRESYIDLGVNLDVKNVTKTFLNVRSLNIWIYIDGVEITEMVAQNVQLPANSTVIVPAVFRIDKNKVPATLWSSLINKSLKNSVVTFKGIARANGRPYPFVVEMTVGELVDYATS